MVVHEVAIANILRVGTTVYFYACAANNCKLNLNYIYTGLVKFSSHICSCIRSRGKCVTC